VLFLHGIPTWSYLWRDVVEAVPDGRRVLAPDMIGYGNSDVRDGFDRSIRAQEAAVSDLLDGLGVDEVAFVGHDLGGGVGLRLAAHEPERVRSLVLSNAVAYDSWPVEPVLEWGLPSFPEEHSPEEVREILAETFRGTLVRDDPPEEFVEGMVAPYDSEQAVRSLSRNAVATNTSHTTELDYESIDVETLLLWGADDEFQPIEDAERLTDDVPVADVVGLDDATHWVTEDRPEAYREELRAFLVEG
jgi:pimeloyl-ACP methyl ester carboxylesterase